MLTVGVFAQLRDCIRAGEPVALATVVEWAAEGAGAAGAGPGDPLPPLGAKILVRRGAETLGSFGDPDLDGAVIRDALGALETDRTTTSHYGPHGEAERSDVAVFLEVFAASHRMVIVGAVDFTSALVKVAKILGYRVTVCDARPAFATAARFPDADDVVVDWPHRYLATVVDQLGPNDALCVLTHDHKFDVPAIVVALRSRVGYIGAMGSRGTHAGRIERLRREGIDVSELGRLMAPIGIDLGARTPGETAVAICAEIIATRTGTPVTSLRSGAGPIHRASDERS